MDLIKDVFPAFSFVVSVLMPHVIRIVIILAGVLVARAVLRSVVRRALGAAEKRGAVTMQRLNTLTGVMRNLIEISLWGLALLLILGEIGIKLGPILAAAGVVGVAIGFGAQSLVKDVFSGFFRLLEGQVRIGDVVEAAGKSGAVEAISLRVLTLRDFTGSVHIIPHGEITTLTNMTKQYSFAVVDVGVAYREDPDRVMRVLTEEAVALKDDPEVGKSIMAEPEVFGIDGFGDSALVFKVRFKTSAGAQWNAARLFRRRLKVRLDKENIEIPFPSTTVYWGVNKDGIAPTPQMN